MPTAIIHSLLDRRDTLNIYSIDGHDMVIHTEHCNPQKDDYRIGRNVRIYSWAGSQNFADLHDQLRKAVNTRTLLDRNLEDMLEWSIDLDRCEKTELIDHVADQSVMTVYRSAKGDIGLSTAHTTHEKIKGPVVWLCMNEDHDSSPAMRSRRRIFEPVFDLTEKLAAQFNRPKPE